MTAMTTNHHRVEFVMSRFLCDVRVPISTNIIKFSERAIFLVSRGGTDVVPTFRFKSTYYFIVWCMVSYIHNTLENKS
jgi:hypothetical protein